MKKAVFIAFTAFLFLFVQSVQGDSELTAEEAMKLPEWNIAINELYQDAAYRAIQEDNPFILIPKERIKEANMVLKINPHNKSTSDFELEVAKKAVLVQYFAKERKERLENCVMNFDKISDEFCRENRIFNTIPNMYAQVKNIEWKKKEEKEEKKEALYITSLIAVSFILIICFIAKTEINENEKEKEKNAWQTKPQDQWNQTDHENYRIYLEKELREQERKRREEEIDSKLEELPDIVSTAFKNMTDTQKIFFFCTTATILMLLAAILWEWPYGCYRLLKIAVTGVSIRYICCQLHPVIKFIFIAVAILYNPILPIELDERKTWQIINALTIPLLGYSEVIIMMKVSKLWPSEK